MRLRKDARALAALVELVAPVSDRNKWMSVAETLPQYSLATSTCARVDTWFQAAGVLRNASPDCLKAAARSGNLEIHHEIPFLFGESFPNPAMS